MGGSAQECTPPPLETIAQQYRLARPTIPWGKRRHQWNSRNHIPASVSQRAKGELISAVARHDSCSQEAAQQRYDEWVHLEDYVLGPDGKGTRQSRSPIVLFDMMRQVLYNRRVDPTYIECIVKEDGLPPNESSEFDLPTRTLSLDLPAFLLVRLLKTKFHDADSLLEITRIYLGLIKRGAYDPGEQADILAGLMRLTGKFGLINLVEPIIEAFVRPFSRNPHQGRSTGLERKEQTSHFDPMFLVLNSLLLTHHQITEKALQNTDNALDDALRSAMGRVLALMNKHGQLDAPRVAMVSFARVLDSRGRKAVLEWLESQQTAAAFGRLPRRNRSIHSLRTDTAHLWMALSVQQKFFRNPPKETGSSRRRSSDKSLPEYVTFMFRWFELDALHRGQMTVKLREAMSFSALRDGQGQDDQEMHGLGATVNQVIAARVQQSQQARGGVKATANDTLISTPRDAIYTEITVLKNALSQATRARDLDLLQTLTHLVKDFADKHEQDLPSSSNSRDRVLWGSILALQSDICSALLRVTSSDPRVSKQVWNQTCSSMPAHALTNVKVLSTMMAGHYTHGSLDQAWNCWDRLVSLDLVNPVPLTIAIRIMSDTSGIDSVVKFVDEWAKRPDAQHNNSFPSARRNVKHKVQLDTVAVNVLMHACHRHSRPDLIYWLWNNMKKRWGVEPDGVTLRQFIHFLDIEWLARNAKGGRFHMAAMNEQRWQKQMQEAARIPAAPARVVANHFYSVLASLHPSVITVQFPLDQGLIMSALKQVITTGHLPTANMPPTDGGEGDHDEGRDQEPSPVTRLSLPASMAYPKIKLDADIFRAYMMMMLRRDRLDDAIHALGWMKFLHLVPDREIMTKILTTLAEEGRQMDLRFLKHEHGWKRYRMLSADEWLRIWLQRWLGSDAVPSEQDLIDQLRQRQMDLSQF